MSWTQGPLLPSAGHWLCDVLGAKLSRWQKRHAGFKTFARHNLEHNTPLFPYFVMKLQLEICPVCQVTRVSHRPL